MLEGDAIQIVVNAVKVKERNRSNFGQIVDDIRSVLNTLQLVSLPCEEKLMV